MNHILKQSEEYIKQGYETIRHDEEKGAFFESAISIFLVKRIQPLYESFYLAELDEVFAVGDSREEALKNFKNILKTGSSRQS